MNVVDTAAGRILPGRSVLLDGKDIRSVAGSKFRPPKGATVIDGSRKYLMPGLWDMNVHLWFGRSALAQYLAAGITGVRDMGSDPVRTREWRREVEDGSLLGPHVETCGAPFDGVPSTDPRLPVIVPRSPSDARLLYDRVDGDGVDFIGVLPRLHADVYYALIDRGRKWGLPVAGLVPDELSVWDAIDARQRSMEEMAGLLLACSREENKLRLRLLKAEQSGDAAMGSVVQARALDTFDLGRAEELFHRMARFSVWQTPTLVMRRHNAFDLYSTLVNRMQADGVPLLAGSGAGEAGLHDELETMVASGLTPAQALRTATTSAAQYLDAEESLGSVEPGKLADLVLLNADPLADIRNTRRIVAVFVGGRYLPKAKLDELAGALARSGPRPGPGPPPRIAPPGGRGRPPQARAPAPQNAGCEMLESG